MPIYRQIRAVFNRKGKTKMSKNNDILEFSLVLEEKPVKLTGKDGVTKNYVLRELDGQKRDSYMNKMKEVTIVEKGEVVGFKTFEGLQSSLLAECLFDEDNKLVDQNTIQSFPSKVLGKLFEAAQKISGLETKESKVKCPKCGHKFAPGKKKDNDVKEEAKND
jgi:hypothetical protein